MIDHKNKAIMIHIDKCAGTSICNYFKAYKGGHSNWSKYKEVFPDAWDTYFKFTFVRNPWDRVVSSLYWHLYHTEVEFYNSRRKRRIGARDIKRQELYREWIQNFNHFLRDDDCLPRIIRSKHNKKFNPCYKYIYDKDMNLMVDFIGKYETINEDMMRIQSILGLPIETIPHNNSLKEKRPHYSAFYNEENIEIIRDLYSTDIEMFGYEFERVLPYDESLATNSDW
jgi:hypothetical protein